MQLIKAKIRGTGATLDTRWFDIHRGCTTVLIADGVTRKNFLHALHSINPNSHQITSEVELFTSEPRLIRKRGHLFQIKPHKRTVAMGVYAATPELVTELGRITPHLFETDRIEVGRRLDSSRWMNFVELAASTRWSEIAEAMQPYLASPAADKAPYRILQQLVPADRVTGEVHDALLQLLDEAIPPVENEQEQALREQILRVDHFRKARSIVYQKLPQSTLLSMPSPAIVARTQLQPAEADMLTTFQQTFPEQYAQLSVTSSEESGITSVLRFQAMKAILTSQQTNTSPLFLINIPELQLSTAERQQLAEFITRLSNTGQVIIATGDESLLHLTDNLRAYTEEQLTADIFQEQVA